MPKSKRDRAGKHLNQKNNYHVFGNLYFLSFAYCYQKKGS